MIKSLLRNWLISGRSSTTVGRAVSLQACAMRVWQEVEEARRGTWSSSRVETAKVAHGDCVYFFS